MLSRPVRAVAAAALACAVLAGCQPAETPSPTPAPRYQCTPEAGGDPFDCSQAQYDDMVPKDKLYAEAEAVYRRFLAEDERIFRAGGVKEPTQVLLDTTTGVFLEDSMEVYRALAESHTKLVGGEMRLVSLVRVPGVSKQGSVVSMRSCVDGTTAKLVEKGSPVGNGTAGSDLLYFARADGALKISTAEGNAVKSC